VYQEVTHLVGFSLAGAPIQTLRAAYGGFARQTPMLAGRVSAKGPYGWHGRSETLEDRVTAGFEMHRWEGASEGDGAGKPEVPVPAPADAALTRTIAAIREGNAARIVKIKAAAPKRASAIAAYARQGLVPPPREARELTEQEARGKAIFLSERAGCSGCHVPETGYTDRGVVRLGEAPSRPGFDEEDDALFKTPSLLYVGGTPPYYHDGHAATLEELVEKNHDRMGHTDHLKRAERAALVAFLRTL
jgi:cytochrome c peroxidase